jgi:hypothetical protein
MRSALSIDVAAPPELVFGLARDVTRWSHLLPHYRRSRAIRREPGGALLVEFVARRDLPVPGLGLLVTWRARTWWEADACRLRFVHVGGATAGMDVTWRIEPLGNGARVTIDHRFAAPPAWAGFIDRFFTRPIAGRTLTSFRAIVEAVHESGAARPANYST